MGGVGGLRVDKERWYSRNRRAGGFAQKNKYERE